MDKWVKEHVERLKAKYADIDWKDSYNFQCYVALHDRFTKEKGVPSSCEGLIDCILKNGFIYTCNIISFSDDCFKVRDKFHNMVLINYDNIKLITEVSNGGSNGNR